MSYLPQQLTCRKQQKSYRAPVLLWQRNASHKQIIFVDFFKLLMDAMNYVSQTTICLCFVQRMHHALLKKIEINRFFYRFLSETVQQRNYNSLMILEQCSLQAIRLSQMELRLNPHVVFSNLYPIKNGVV